MTNPAIGNYVFAYFALGASLLLLSIAIYLKHPRTQVNRLFAAYSFAISWWSLCTLPMITAQNATAGYGWDQICLVGAIFIPTTFLHFLVVFLNIKHRNRIVPWLYGITTIFLVANITKNLVPEVQPRFAFNYYTVPGIFYHLFVFYFSSSSTVGTLLLFYHWRKQETGSRFEKQAKWLFFTSLLGYLGGATNFLLVYGLYIDFITPYANYAVLAYAFGIAFLILRYQFLDIEVFIKRTLVFAGLFAVMMFTVALVSTVTEDILGQWWQFNSMWSRALSVIVAMALYNPTKRLLVNVTDKFLFQKQFRLSSIVAQASYAIAFVQSLKWLARRIVAFLVLKCRIKHAVVYIRSDATGSFIRGALRGYPADPQPPQTLPETHMMIRYLYESRAAIEIRRLEELMDKNPNHLARTGLEMVYEFLKAARAEVVIPSFLRRRIEDTGMGKEQSSSRDRDEGMVLRNILILGGKKSDEPYSDEDLEVFYSLAQESAIAIENARLYDEAVEKTRLLADMNRELGDMNSKLQVTQASLIVAEKNATMVGMAQAIGHEVNNPLTTVLMRTDIVYRDKIKKFKGILEEVKGKMTEEEFAKVMKSITVIEDDIGRASRSAHRINAVVHTLTDILRDTKGEMGSLSLRVLFHEALEATRFSTYEENLAGCDMKLEVASNVMIRGNLEQLLQVFINLIKNAYEAMDKTRDRRIQIQGDVDPEDPKMARIVVSDNGPGIPPDVLPRIWGQGFSTKQKKDDSIGAAGQGQGLFICKHMIESVHRGAIMCESEVGKGTRFIIKLPLAEMEITYTEPTAG